MHHHTPPVRAQPNISPTQGDKMAAKSAKEKSPFDKIRQPNKRAMLAAYAIKGRVGLAAEAAGIDRTTHYVWLKEDAKYAELFNGTARIMASDYAEDVMWDRSIDGWDEPVYQGGALVGSIRKYDHTLLKEIVRANNPEKFKERNATELTGANGGPVEVLVTYAD